MRRWNGLKPGWYLLAAVAVYAAGVTVLFVGRGEQIRDMRAQIAAPRTPNQERTEQEAVAQVGLWFPIPGARLPQNPAHLPGSIRAYRQGVNEGFDFYDGDSGVPVPYGAAVIASASGELVRVDNVYQEPSAQEWQALMQSVADGASEDELDRLRGRQVWLETDAGLLLRYGHLSGIAPGLMEGQRVERGEVLGYVGNSGTDEGVAGTELGARLHFEVWEGDTFFGENLNTEELRIAAVSLFTGP
ncbi:MAG TPA: M23 family metallopeptidase [Trueperaceae bacterium]